MSKLNTQSIAKLCMDFKQAYVRGYVDAIHGFKSNSEKRVQDMVDKLVKENSEPTQSPFVTWGDN